MAKINQEEYEVLKSLGDDWKWIARDNPEDLFIYKERPKRFEGTQTWDDLKDNCAYLKNDLFQFIQWEDESPYNIAELIEEYEKDYKGSWEHAIEFSKELYRESEKTEVKKDIEWLIEKLEILKKTDREMWEKSEPNSKNQSHFNGSMATLDKVLDLLSQLDEPEVLSQREIINIVLDGLKEHIKEQQSLSQNVGMAHTPAGNDTHYRQYDYVLECINEYEPSEDLQNLLVPKREEADRAYKDGYEKVKEHATRDDEPETVASVVADYFRAAARLKEVLAMEVEELEE